MKRPVDYARDDLGTKEWRSGHNPKVVRYFSDVGHDWVKDDETAWCAAFVGAMLKKAGIPHTGKLNARSYLDWGDPVTIDDAREGDVVVFPRGNPNGWRGHVGFVVAMHDHTIEVIGGNQSDKVTIATYPIGKILGIRRWPTADVDTVKPTGLAAVVVKFLSLLRRKSNV